MNGRVRPFRVQPQYNTVTVPVGETMIDERGRVVGAGSKIKVKTEIKNIEEVANGDHETTD